MSERDFQRERVYRWQRNFPQGKWLKFEDIPEYVNRVWMLEGLEHPPLVYELHPNDRHGGKGNRMGLWFPKHGACKRTVLHEIAHSMTGNIEGTTDRHGPQFVGVFIKLLDRHMCIPSTALWYKAEVDKVKFDMFAKPWMAP